MILEHLIVELTSRGYHEGSIKEIVRIPTLDTPQTETNRYPQAGAENRSRSLEIATFQLASVLKTNSIIIAVFTNIILN